MNKEFCYAQKATYVAEAAGIQRKFWEMHDLLFKNQNDWADKSNADELFLSYAKELKLNEAQFKKDTQSKTIRNKVYADVLSGQQAGINSTPTFVLNGEKLDIPPNFDGFKKNIKEALEKK